MEDNPNPEGIAVTQDEIIELARQAGLPEAIIEMTPIAFEAFAKLVAEKVQDGNCKKCKDGCPACDARKLPNDLL